RPESSYDALRRAVAYPFTRHGHDVACRQRLETVITPHLPPLARPRQAVAQAEHVACDGTPRRAVLPCFTLHVVDHLLLDGLACQRRACRTPEELLIPLRQPPRI